MDLTDAGYCTLPDTKEEEFRQKEREGQIHLALPIEKNIGKLIGKDAGKVTRVKSRTPQVGKVPTPVEELLKNKTPTKWVVDSFGAKGAALLLAGDKGSGETAFCYRLAESVSKGEAFLEQLETVQSKVLVWQADESKINALDKLDHMGIVEGIDFVFEEDEGCDELDIPRLKKHLQQGEYEVQ